MSSFFRRRFAAHFHPLAPISLALASAFSMLAAASDAPLAAPGIRPAAPTWCSDRCDALVIDWNATAHQVITAANGYADPMAASRVLAMVHLAMHDAVNAVHPRYASHLGGSDRDAGADAAVAAASAAHGVLAGLFPAQQAVLKAALDSTLHDAGSGAAAQRGVALGRRIAEAMLARRAADGADLTLPYQPGTRPGQYRFTPGFDFVASPHWRHVQPFVLASPGQFRSPAPPALTSDEYAADLAEVKAVGTKAADARRSLDETHYAAFWYEFSDVGWNRIARVVARSHKQDLWERARTFALLNAVMADAYIAGWDSKFQHDFWRPVTAIRLAATDGNPRTVPDAAWEPLLPTPPVQDHPSTHSALGAAAATVLAEAFGRDRVRFSFTSTTAMPANPERRFGGFAEAARENADSRVKAGLHFRFATRAGLRLGEQIGRHAVRNALHPVD